jgi:hypothetical protein
MGSRHDASRAHQVCFYGYIFSTILMVCMLANQPRLETRTWQSLELLDAYILSFGRIYLGERDFNSSPITILTFHAIVFARFDDSESKYSSSQPPPLVAGSQLSRTRTRHLVVIRRIQRCNVGSRWHLRWMRLQRMGLCTGTGRCVSVHLFDCSELIWHIFGIYFAYI